MIKKVIFCGIVLCLFIAIPLAVLGYERVTLGPQFISLMRSVSQQLEEFKIQIPDIPPIDRFETQDVTGILEVLIGILNGLIYFINMIITIINALVGVLNVIIQLLQVIFLFVKSLITFKDSVTPVVV